MWNSKVFKMDEKLTKEDQEELARKRDEFLTRDIMNEKLQLIVEFHDGDILPATKDYEDAITTKIFRTKSREDFKKLVKEIINILKKFK